MTRTKSMIIVLVLLAGALAVAGCDSASFVMPAPQEEAPAPAVEAEQVDSDETTADDAEVAGQVVTETETTSEPEAEAETTEVETEEVMELEDAATEEVVEVEDEAAEEMVETGDETAESVAETDVELVEEGAEAEADTLETEPADGAAEEAVELLDIEAVVFTATTGLDEFSAYRINFEAAVDGTQRNRPTGGTLNGLFEVTKNPEAKHWKINMEGDTFDELAILGNTMELYDLGSTFYIQNPQGDGFIGVPALFVQSMLPAEMDNIENSIELPATAVPHPGEEIINGVVTRRYTFGKDDLATNWPDLDSVDGAIWVAVDGDYVVKYEATVSGKFSQFSAGGINMLDEGTVVMSYEMTDANGDFSINAPANAQGMSLTDLLFN